MKIFFRFSVIAIMVVFTILGLRSITAHAKVSSMSVDSPTSFAWYNTTVPVTVTWDSTGTSTSIGCRTLVQIFVNGVIQPANFGSLGFGFKSMGMFTKTFEHLLGGISDGVYDLTVTVKDDSSLSACFAGGPAQRRP